MGHSDLVILEVFGNEIEAELAKGALHAAGIETVISADNAGGMRPHLAWAGSGFKLLVREDELATARGMLDEINGRMEP